MNSYLFCTELYRKSIHFNRIEYRLRFECKVLFQIIDVKNSFCFSIGFELKSITILSIFKTQEKLTYFEFIRSFVYRKYLFVLRVTSKTTITSFILSHNLIFKYFIKVCEKGFGKKRRHF